ATLAAMWQFTAAKLRGHGLAWRKTAHVYPVQAQATDRRPRLGEVLVRMHCLSTRDLEEALRTCPPGTRLGEHLRQMRHLSEDVIYEALSSQAGMPLGVPEERPSRNA